jgi:hypothetical protein
LLVLAFGLITFFYAGQNSIAYAIQDANSPAAVMRRQASKRTSIPAPTATTTNTPTTTPTTTPAVAPPPNPQATFNPIR